MNDPNRTGQTMNALVIYDEHEWVFKAGNALRYAAHNANINVSWEIKPWRTDILKFPRAADKALVEAVRADFIVFAGVRLDLLAVWFGEWLDRWVMQRKIEDIALVVMNRRSSEGRVLEAPSWLSKFAANHRLGFISHAFDPRPPAFNRQTRPRNVQKREHVHLSF